MRREPSDWRASARTHFEALLDTVEADVGEARDRAMQNAREEARTQLAECLNQGLRRLRNTAALAECYALTGELAAGFAAMSAVILFQETEAHATAMNGMGRAPLSFAPAEAAAFRAAIESGDPVIAAGTPSEISPQLAERVGVESIVRVSLFPLQVRGVTHAVLFAADASQPAVLELIAGMAAMRMEVLTPATPTKRGDLIIIDAPAPAAAAGAWTDLPPDIQALHLRAQRLARTLVADMRLQHGAELRRGIQQRNLYDALRHPIDTARDAYRTQFLPASPTMVDYLYLELVRGLAQDDERLLGPSFPGPLI